MDNKQLEDTFWKLVDKYDDETCVLSYVDHNNENFKQIINLATLNYEIIPLLISCFEKDKFGWAALSALKMLVPEAEQPTFSEEVVGRYDLLSELWISWGKDQL